MFGKGIIQIQVLRIQRLVDLEADFPRHSSLDQKQPAKAIPPTAGRNGILSRRGDFALLDLFFYLRVFAAEFLSVFNAGLEHFLVGKALGHAFVRCAFLGLDGPRIPHGL